jgi:hypothetical protein
MHLPIFEISTTKFTSRFLLTPDMGEYFIYGSIFLCTKTPNYYSYDYSKELTKIVLF